MSSLFSKPSAPQLQPLPAAPADDQAAAQARADAASAAQMAAASAGRQSTMVAGMSIASEDQMNRGMLSLKKRAAARELG